MGALQRRNKMPGPFQSVQHIRAEVLATPAPALQDSVAENLQQWALHENEHRYDAIVGSRLPGAHPRGIKCLAGVVGAGGAGMLDVGDVGGLGREFDR